MNTSLRKKTFIPFLYEICWLTFFASFIFSFRAVTSIAIGVLLAAGITKNKLENKPIFFSRLINPFFAGCVLFYALQLLSILYTHNRAEAWDHARIKSGLLFIPLIIYCTDYLYGTARSRLLFFYSLILTVACLYCLIQNGLHYQQTHDNAVFFYHQLVKPISQHAVFFSILVIIALVYLLEDQLNSSSYVKKWTALLLVLFLSGFLFLLSSKLLIAFYLFYMVAYFIRLLKRRRSTKLLTIFLFILFAGGGIVLLVSKNPIERRFKDITYWDTRWMYEGQYSPGDYFNGLQFRLLQWKLVTEILNEHHAWITGVTPGDAQNLLDQKYVSKNMYTGDPQKPGSHGYLGYHTHNQLLQSLLQSGILGALIYILILGSVIQMIGRNKTWISRFLIILLLAWSFTDAVFETQYGLLIFIFFVLFFDQSSHSKKEHSM